MKTLNNPVYGILGGGRLQRYCQALRENGMSEPEIKRAADRYEAKLNEESARAKEDQVNTEGLTSEQLATLNFERSFQNLPSLQPAKTDEADLHRELTSDQIATLNLERACDGLGPISADELARENIGGRCLAI